ncbi:MAG: cupin domain-containing protein [Candidatus Dormibacteria bacterium]
MSEPGVRVVSGSELERDEDEDGFLEVLRPSVSGVPGIWVSRFVTFKGGSVPPHFHTSNSIAYLVRGSAAFRTGEGFTDRHEMKAGDYITVPKNVAHMEETIGDETAEFLIVRDEGGGDTVYLDQ